jgi:CelD/BcsL family acetyltransferase involved in cellulose biosynthesis
MNAHARIDAEPTTLAAEAFDLAAIEPLWRELERTGTGSPFQRYDWVRAFAQATGADTRILVLREGGRPVLLLPLALTRSRGFRIAAPIGGKHASFNLPLLAPGPVPGPDAVRAALKEAGGRLGLDAYAFMDMPLSWAGRPNPLAEGGRPSPSNGCVLTLDADPEACLGRPFSKESRKKMRARERKLAGIGPIRFGWARTPEEVETILAAFFVQKAARFAQLGIRDVFADEGIRAFVRAACTVGLAESRPAIDLYALFAGERIVAVNGAAADARRCSGMFNAFDIEPAVARSGPGELLFVQVIAEQCRRGLAEFDLGVGEAAYKSVLCDRIEPLVDVILPVSAAGRLYAFAAAHLLRAKRAIKGSGPAMRVARRLQAILPRS